MRIRRLRNLTTSRFFEQRLFSTHPTMKALIFLVTWLALIISARMSSAADSPDLILHNGKIAAVDDAFSIHRAIAVRDGRILQLGSDKEILQLRGPETEVINLRGKLVLPGLIDSHSHPADAAMTEFDHPLPQMENIADVLNYIRARAEIVPPGDWIAVRQVFITRLAEQRYPTRAELDGAAPRHPVLFATGPDASLNSLALSESGIDRNFVVTDGGGGFAEKDPQSGELTGILRNATRFVKTKPSSSASRTPNQSDKLRRLAALFADYNSVGLTSIADRSASADEIALFKAWREFGPLSIRVHLSRHINTIGSLEGIQSAIVATAKDPLFTNKDDYF